MNLSRRGFLKGGAAAFGGIVTLRLCRRNGTVIVLY